MADRLTDTPHYGNIGHNSPHVMHSMRPKMTETKQFQKMHEISLISYEQEANIVSDLAVIRRDQMSDIPVRHVYRTSR